MKILKLLMLFAAICLTAGAASAADTPAAEEWGFEMEKVWEIQKIGEDELLRPAEPRVADNGTLYVHDFERHISYIIDSTGELVARFAPRGEGEGEVPFYINCFTAGDYVVVGAPDKLHFFASQGQFVKAVPNNLFVRFPLAVKNDREYWVAPGALGDSPGGVAAVTFVNLEAGEETSIFEFTLSNEEKKPTGGGVVPGLTPQAKMGYDRTSDQLYFGKNSDTVIYRFDNAEGEIDSFTFAGESRPVSVEDKRNHFSGHDIPPEYLDGMIEALPDHMAHYDRIQVINGLVYLVRSDNLSRNPSALSANVYSPDGRHLFYGRIEVEDGWHIFGTPDNLQLGRDGVYVIQENESGDKKIVKYRVSFP